MQCKLPHTHTHMHAYTHMHTRMHTHTHTHHLADQKSHHNNNTIRTGNKHREELTHNYRQPAISREEKKMRVKESTAIYLLPASHQTLKH